MLKHCRALHCTEVVPRGPLSASAMPAPREYTHQVPPGKWFSSDEYLTDVNWEIPVGDPAAYSARLDPGDADEWDQDFGMQRLKDISSNQ